MSEINRRSFIQLSVLSAAAASVLAGCKNEDLWKEEATGQYGGSTNKIYPYVNQPVGQTDGVPTYFATTCQMCSAGCGLYIRTLGGRANTVHGNPEHPLSAGKSCLRGQLSLQHLYNPDRLMQPMIRKEQGGRLELATWDAAYERASKELKDAHGKTAILIDADTVGRSPSKLALLEQLRLSTAGTLQEYTLLDDAPWRASSLSIYGRNQLPDYRLDLADLIVSFGGNFLETWPSPVHYAALFGEFRQGVRRSPGGHGLFIYVGPRLSMTAAKADIWLPCKAGTERYVAQGVLNELGGGGINASESAAITGLSIQQIQDLATAIRTAGQHFVAIGGDGLYSTSSVTQAFQDIEHLNVVTKSRCVQFGSSPLKLPPIVSGARSLNSLLRDMLAGQVNALIIVGECNPVHTFPTDEWKEAVRRVPFTLSITSFLNETTSHSDVALPARTFLEEWTDHLPSVLPSNFRMANLSQPVIDPEFITVRHRIDSNNQPVPLMSTREMTAICSDLISIVDPDYIRSDGAEQSQKFWRAHSPLKSWQDSVSNGGDWTREEALSSQTPTFGFTTRTTTVPSTSDEFGLVLFPHLYFGDGRHANLGWAQEMPDPMTSAVWNCWLEINAATAHKMGIRTGDVVLVRGPGGSIELPALPSQGIHPDVVAAPIGQGHTSYGRNASGTGANVLALVGKNFDPLTGAYAYSSVSVTIKKVREAVSGYHADLNTLVLVEDRPHGEEPPAVKQLIHETAAQWKKQQSGTPSNEGKAKRERPIL